MARENKNPRFPRIAECIRENEMSMDEFIMEIGYVIGKNAYYKYQRGEIDPPYRFIRAVMESTLLPFEEAFEEVQHEAD